jgi:hypothetical protein
MGQMQRPYKQVSKGASTTNLESAQSKGAFGQSKRTGLNAFNIRTPTKANLGDTKVASIGKQ